VTTDQQGNSSNYAIAMQRHCSSPAMGVGMQK
jgi:hypothetical protein